MSGQIKLTRSWKSVHVPDYPLKLLPNERSGGNSDIVTRSANNSHFKDWSKTKVAESSFTIDATKLWNIAPDTIKNAVSLQNGDP